MSGPRPPDPAAGWERDQVAEGRDVAARDRDSAADARDRQAGDRAEAAGARDATARERQAARDRARAAGSRPDDDEQAAVDAEVEETSRAMAEADREAAAADRVADAADRVEAFRDRRAAAEDRAAAREDRAAAVHDRARARAEREQAEVERATTPPGPPSMSAEEVVRVVDALGAAGCRGWLEGGWGVDALVGRQTRPHRDLDLDVDAAEADEVLEVLAGLGYRVLADHRPHRVELVHPERGLVDLHLLTFDAAGDAVQQGEHGERWPCPAGAFTTGRVHGRAVGTLTAAQQTAWHEGYELRDVDRADLVHLRRLQHRGSAGSRGEVPFP